MTVYADTSFLVSLYTPDSNSEKAAARMSRLPVPVLLTTLGELELVNAMQLRLFRRELPAAQLRAAYAAFRADVQAGILAVRPLSEAAYAQARRLATRWTASLGTRTLDVLHVASALALGADIFQTFDDRQARLARAAGLTTASRP